jgi:hypothetical protein
MTDATPPVIMYEMPMASSGSTKSRMRSGSVTADQFPGPLHSVGYSPGNSRFPRFALNTASATGGSCCDPQSVNGLGSRRLHSRRPAPVEL